MADRLKVSADNMKNDHEQMKERVDQLISNANEIRDLVHQLNQYYEGPAYETFKTVMSNGLDKLNELMNFWNNYLNSFEEADKSYKELERKVYDYVHDLKS